MERNGGVMNKMDKIKDIPNWEKEFDRRFMDDTDNGVGCLWVFRLNPDGTRSIALTRDIKDFITALKTPYPAVTSHRKCNKCGEEMRKHGYLEATNEAICL